jgi:hypothetical protein
VALLERIVREGGDEYLFDELMREPAAAMRQHDAVVSERRKPSGQK